MKRYQTSVCFSLVAILGFGLAITSWGCKGNTQGPSDPVITKKIAPAPKAQTPKRSPVDKGPNRAMAATPADTPAAAAASADPKPDQMARLPYNPVGKLDPFRPLFKEEPKPQKDKKAKPKAPERPRTPLERLDLGQLQLTAIVFSQNRPRAMVEESSGKGYVVEIGTPIGLERGQVTQITRDRIVIEHLKSDDFGNTSSQRRELKLQKPPGD